LLRRTRTVDPSIGTGGGYQQFNQGYGPSQPAYGGQGFNQFQDQGGHQQPGGHQGGVGGSGGQPAIFTPETMAMKTPARSRTNSQSGGSAAFPPLGFKHTPDHGGPGWKPPVSNAHGWNDPPPSVVSKPRTAPLTPSYTNQGPISQPLMTQGQGQGAPEVLPPSSGFQPAPIHNIAPAAPADYQQNNPAIPSSNSGWGGFQPAAVGGYNQGPGMMGGAPGMMGGAPGMMGGAPGMMGGAPQAQEAPAQPPPAPEPVPLAPIPQEHVEIQEVLDGLLNRCKQASGHPQVKRKLDDVQTKLDILYNKLRSSSLSGDTLQGLHHIILLVRQYDYMSCTQVISGLIAGGSFAELADFMPGIKVLIQVAQQSGVYLEQTQ